MLEASSRLSIARRAPSVSVRDREPPPLMQSAVEISAWVPGKVGFALSTATIFARTLLAFSWQNPF